MHSVDDHSLSKHVFSKLSMKSTLSLFHLNSLTLPHHWLEVVKYLQMESLQNLLVVRILSPYPIRMFENNLVPDPISKIRVE